GHEPALHARGRPPLTAAGRTFTFPAMPKTPTATPAQDTLPVAEFETALGELEGLVARMETGELSLDDSLGNFERGIALYRQCQRALDPAARQGRQLLDAADPDSAVAFDPDACARRSAVSDPLQSLRQRCDDNIQRSLGEQAGVPTRLLDAMRHGVLAGGKRL